MRNWIARQNPWSLMPPPAWWLAQLAERDAALVVMPGIKEPGYRIARRSALMRKVKPVNGNDSETGRMCREGLIPVVSIRPDVTWNNDIFLWLDEHDSWRFKGTDKVVERLDELERKAAEQIDRVSDDENDQRSVSAYFAKLMREGALAFVGGTQNNSAG